MKQLPRIFILYFCCLSVSWMSPRKAYAQTILSCNEITEEMGFTVRSVKIEGDWVSQSLKQQIEKEIGVGQPYSSNAVAVAKELIISELKQQEKSEPVIAAAYVDLDICRVFDEENSHQVEITFYPYHLQVNQISVGNDILFIPSVTTPSFSARVPSALLPASSTISILNDRNYGTSLGVKTTTNLLNLSPEIKTESKTGAEALNLNLEARRSLSQPFYNINTGVEYTDPDYGGSISPNVGIRYSNQLSPLGEGEDWREQVQIEGGIQQKSTQSFIKNYAFGGSVRFLDSSYTPRNSDLVHNSETGVKLYALSDSRIGDGLARFGAWFDGGFPDTSSSYQRVAIQGGYSTELGEGHNTVGLEVMAGSGYAWGNPPEYSRFFGGSLASNFLYDSLNSPQTRAFPVGPILRSYGEQQAGLRGTNGLVSGGNFYWNVNLTITFPIAAWSQPLIPDEEIEFIDPNDLDNPPLILLPELIKKKINDVKKDTIKAIKNDLIKRGYPDNEDTTTIARKIYDDEIIPTINYVTDRANLYSIKPMLLFDVAQISGDNGLGSTLWAAVGGGIQINIVNGRLEAGYMQTIAPASDSSIGNFFLRLVFQDLF